jgi:hypothetical protein
MSEIRVHVEVRGEYMSEGGGKRGIHVRGKILNLGGEVLSKVRPLKTLSE